MSKIVITCFGSMGDLYPYVALAKELKKRGHNVAIGSSTFFKAQVEAEAIPFFHLRSALDQYTTAEKVRALLKRLFDPMKGGEAITRELMGGVEETYLDTLKVIEPADFVISNPLAYATPIACREQNKLWLSTILAPMFFLSVCEPPIMSPAPWLRKLYSLSPALYRGLFKLLKGATKVWTQPLYQMCEKYHLPPPSGHPVFEGQYSPHGTLAMFPALFAKPQNDWPIKTTMTGFPLLSIEMAEDSALIELQVFIDTGEAPIVFALGSSAVHLAGDFYRISAAISRQLKRRAVLVYGGYDDQVEGIATGDDIFMINYVAYEKLFPHAALIVHQGGIGTLAQSLAAKCPVLIVPFGFDQFDNGERIENMGVGKCLPRASYNVENAAPVIEELLSQPDYRECSERIGKAVQSDDGAANAADVVEHLLANR